MQFKQTLLAGAAIVALASCGQQGEKNTAGEPGRKLLDPANMDTTVHPGDNFFMYANGAWLKANPIPKSKTRWGSFNELQENNYSALHQLLDSAAGVKDASKGSPAQMVGDFYRTGMDSITINKVGITPLNEIMTRINSISDANGVLNEAAMEQTQGMSGAFSFGVSPDDKNVTKEICQFAQGGLGMPGREYYYDNDERTVKIRNAYKVFIKDMLVVMGSDSVTAKKDAEDIYKLEYTLAGASMTKKEARDPYKLYNKYNIEGIDKVTPGVEWKSLLAALKVTGEDSLIVAQPVFFTELGKQLKATPLETWKKYLKFHVVTDMSGYLGLAFDTTAFNFYGKTMSGQEEQEPRWKRVMQVVDGSVGEMLGKMYVDKNFKPEAKKRMLELVNNLQQTYADRIQKVDWMSDETKKKALNKLNAFVKKIGYPDKWKDYSALAIVNNDYIKNVIASSAWAYNYNLSKLGKPVDKTIWIMTPPTVNAYYNPGFNEIVFPAGILQYPFFADGADDAVNYGGIGAVIGHEMTHGFDDVGRKYNSDGNLSNWWTPVDSTNFTNKSNVVVDQFNKIVVIDTSHADGRLTLGENLADLGGISIAYEAFKKTKQGQGNEKIDGFSPDQRFFLSWAQVWRANTRPQELARRLKGDPHSPSELRCNVPISNVEAWYKAFDIKPTDKLFRPANERARVW